MAPKKLSRSKALKYGLLRFLPGDVGRRYKEKHRFREPTEAFRRALEETSDLTSIDLGANVGEYTVQMAQKSRKVIAFEPDPWACAQLRDATMHLSNVEIIEAAAGVEDGTVNLYRHRDFENEPALMSQSSSIMPRKSNIDPEAAIAVTTVDFMRFLRELNEDIGVLKIDIEGAEVDLLEALFAAPDLLGRIRYVFAETHVGRIPEHADRVQALRQAAFDLDTPVVNLFWH